MSATELTPILNVSDFDPSVAWFERVGFSPGFRWSAAPGEPVSFGAVLWGQVEVFLCVGAQGGRGEGGAFANSIFATPAATCSGSVPASRTGRQGHRGPEATGD